MEKVILERVSELGYERIIFRVEDDVVIGDEFYNDEFKSRLEARSFPVEDALKNIVSTYLEKNYIEVKVIGELQKESEKVPSTIKIMYKDEVLEKYSLYLGSGLWDHEKIYVYEEDVVLDEDLDLDEEDKEGERTGMIFLKNLTVNGNIVNDSDYSRPIRVIGKTTAHSILAGAGYLEFNDIELRDALVTGVTEEVGILTINGNIKAKSIVDKLYVGNLFNPKSIDVDFFVSECDYELKGRCGFRLVIENLADY